jgi:hypothetical protein
VNAVWTCLPVSQKKRQTNIQKQEAVLNKMLPASDSQMNTEEQAIYLEYKKALTKENRRQLKNTHDFLLQVCAIQCVPKDPTPHMPEYPVAETVANMNEKIRRRNKGKTKEVLITPPLTVQWVQFCFLERFAMIVTKNP